MYILYRESLIKYTGQCTNDFTAHGYVRREIRQPDTERVHREGAAERRLGMDTKVILTPPCKFCMENH
jgi:hypothetical protein